MKHKIIASLVWVVIILTLIVLNILYLKSKIPECWHGSVTITSDGEYIDTMKSKRILKNKLIKQMKRDTIILYCLGCVGIICIWRVMNE